MCQWIIEHLEKTDYFNQNNLRWKMSVHAHTQQFPKSYVDPVAKNVRLRAFSQIIQALSMNHMIIDKQLKTH